MCRAQRITTSSTVQNLIDKANPLRRQLCGIQHQQRCQRCAQRWGPGLREHQARCGQQRLCANVQTNNGAVQQAQAAGGRVAKAADNAGNQAAAATNNAVNSARSAGGQISDATKSAGSAISNVFSG